MRVRAYRILLMCADELLHLQNELIKWPETDPDDALFNEVQGALDALLPLLQRLSAEPVLPSSIETFLMGL